MKILLIVAIAVICCISCTNRIKMITVVAAKDDNGVLVCDRSLLTDTIVMSLSEFCEDLQMVKLENRDTAFVPTGRVLVSEHYLLLDKSQQTPYKLFDKASGKFIADIGSVGRGPGEYQWPCDKYIDEKAGRIYLLPWMSNRILVYDMSGKPLDPIRFPTFGNGQTLSISKGVFYFDSNKEQVSVAQIPFGHNTFAVWTQMTYPEQSIAQQDSIESFPTGLIGEVNASIVGVNPLNSKGQFNGFNNDIESGKNTNAFDIYFYTSEPRVDSLYHYDLLTHELKPVFTIKFPNMLPTHSYGELPGYYLGFFSDKKQVAEDQSVSTNIVFYIVNKTDLTGAFFKLKNDYLGDMEVGIGNNEISWPCYAFSNGYYTENWDPGDLLEALERTLNENDMSASMRDKLTQLKNSISENDNNYVFYAKLK